MGNSNSNPNSKKNIQSLQKINVENATDVPYKNKLIKAKIIDIHDGDTIKVIILLGHEPFKFSIRVNGIDAPEVSRCENWEKEAGLKVRDYVRSIIKGEIITIKLTSLDKYGGRYIGDVYLTKNLTLSEHLLKEELVKPYDGGTKNKYNRNECNVVVNKVNLLM